jgi:PadR family transcriptional regulator, regulatory protein PadR
MEMTSGTRLGDGFKRQPTTPNQSFCDTSSLHKQKRVQSYCIPIEGRVECSYWLARGERKMGDKTDVWQGTLALMVLRTLESMGPQHGYGLARRIEQTSGDQLQLNYGTLYPALLKLEQEGYIRSHWGNSENNRRAKFYELTKAGQRQVRKAAAEWEQTTEILARFLAPVTEA